MRLPQMMTDALTLHLRVRPGAKRTCLKKILADGSIKIDIAAPAEDNRANLELISFIAEQHGVQRNAVEILSGQTSGKKVVRVQQS
jgi:uncharacterized protein